MNLSSQPWSSSAPSSRSTTPTPRPGRSTPSPSSHPLRLPTSPQFAELEAFASTSASSLGANGSASASGGVRSRKAATQNGSSSSSAAVDADVTRPTLKRLTGETVLAGVEAAAAGAEADKGKGKSRRSFDELGRSGKSEAEREVVVHELVKTDTIASISLQYGITPQALRSSNRLWSSDAIHGRRILHIPLDQCHLPSSSTIERVAREEDGNLVVWERSDAPPILSPLARRAASAFELSSSSHDLLDFDSSRSSLESFREPYPSNGKGKGKAPALLIDGQSLDLVSEYLPSTNNPYSFSAPPSPPSSSVRASPDLYGRLSPPSALDPDPDPSFASLPPSSSASLSRRTLTVTSVPASSLSFFPPPNPSFSNPSSARSSFDDSSSPTLPNGTFSSTTLPTPKAGPRLTLPNSSSHHWQTASKGPIIASLPNGKKKPSSTSLGPASGAKPKASWTKKWDLSRWDLSYFGGEEEEGGGSVEFDEARSWGLSPRERERERERKAGETVRGKSGGTRKDVRNVWTEGNGA